MVIHIKAPFFSAGKMFKWEDEHRTIGIGIKKGLVTVDDGNQELQVRVGDNPTVYIINKHIAIDICNKYNSIYVTKEGQVELMVIPFDAFRKEGTEYQPRVLRGKEKARKEQTSLTSFA